jgi:hypothetical protein
MLDQEFEGHVPPPLFPPCSLFLPPCKRRKAALFERTRRHSYAIDIYGYFAETRPLFLAEIGFSACFPEFTGGGDYQ